jgi:SAM-dependent methyltransferase
METVRCILCDSAQSALKLTQRDINLGLGKDTFTLVQCTGCGLIYQNPRPTKTEIQAYYPHEYYQLERPRERKGVSRFFKRLSNRLKREIRRQFYGYPAERRSRLLDLVLRVALYPEDCRLRLTGREILPFRGEGKLLDVGCGAGKTMNLLRQQGWDTYGVDFGAAAVDFARTSLGLNVRLGDLFGAAYKDNFFDVILFSHSLEHMYDPFETLREAFRILKPGGLLVIAVPNARSFEASLFGQWWVHWDVPRHLFHFDKTTLCRLLSKAGYRVASIKDGLGRSSFLGSLDYIYKYVFKFNTRHGAIARSLATPLCLIVGHVGYGSEMKVYAEKPR